MKNTLALLSVAIVAVAAVPHQHKHQQVHQKRGWRGRESGTDYGVTNTDYTVVPGPTVMVYVLNGKSITEDEVRQGIANGTLVWESGGQLSAASSSAEATSTSSAYVPPPTSTSSTSSIYVAPTTSSADAYTPSPTSESSSYSAPSSTYSPPASSPSSASAAPSSSSSNPSPSSGGSNDDSNYDSDSATGVDEDFPDGELDCSTFPSQYGAVPIEWMGLGGWTGVQQPGSSDGGFSNIMTVTKDLVGNDGACTEGSYCSYACPAGYQKAQWPTMQGATGQSVGGIVCQGGKLRLTNPGMSKSLCMTGTDKVTILVQNKLGSNVAICRTDYPGTESETVPLNTQPGSTSNLTCPDADNYYNWQGGHTSAQYYVNPAGVAVSDACQWGSDSNPWGNFAPLNLGVGYSNGAAWLAIFQNAPTTSAKLDFSVEIVGDNLSGSCKYENGQYCSGSSCSAVTGCTVSISEGTATFVFS
ncbi:Beta-glucosidase (SUN) [Teratosphaeriaceae sp. CCFEE 6253]|nr:Beta-glucosidase (SUN) [Teratosphaeriaceae sp. CCFEE 6253]